MTTATPDEENREPSAPFSTPELPDEHEWVEGLKRGDNACYTKLVHAYTNRLLSVARRYLEEDDARDAVQESFIKAFQAIDRFGERSRLSTWLHRIVVNCCLNRLRKYKTKPEVSIDSLTPNFLEDGHRENPTPKWPDEIMELVEKEELVEKCIKKLPETYRTVLTLRDIEGLSGAETAEMLNVSVTAVKVRLHRARQALRELLDPYVQRGSDID